MTPTTLIDSPTTAEKRHEAPRAPRDRERRERPAETPARPADIAPSRTTAEKRLLLVTTIPATLEGFLLPIARHMREVGWRVEAAANGVSSSEACVEAFDAVWDVEWTRNPLDPANLSAAVKRVREIVAEGGHDVVHVHTPVAAFVTRLALRQARAEGTCKVIYTAHGFHFHERNHAAKNLAFLGLEKLAGRWTDRLVLINDYDVEQAHAFRIVDPDHIVHMHGIGIDTERYAPESVEAREAAAFREEIGLTDEPLFLVPAAFDPGKRQKLVLEALAASGRKDVHVAFVGRGPTLPQLRQEAERLGLSKQTHFLGWRTDMQRLYRAADATVLFSEREGLSRAVMEALSMECPVIGSDIRGIRELVSDGCGVAVDPDRPEVLGEVMGMVADDPEWAVTMGRLGREKMSGPYEERRIVAAHEVMYEDAYSQL